MGHQRTPSTGLSRAASLRSNGASGSSSRSSSPVKPTPSTPSSSSASLATPRTSRLAPPSSPAKRPPLALQPRKSFARQSPGESSAPLSPALPLQTPRKASPSQEAVTQVQRTSSPLALPPQNAIIDPPPMPVVQASRHPPIPINSTPSITNGTTLALPPSISRAISHDPSSPITVSS
jgi:dynactin 1